MSRCAFLELRFATRTEVLQDAWPDTAMSVLYKKVLKELGRRRHIGCCTIIVSCEKVLKKKLADAEDATGTARQEGDALGAELARLRTTLDEQATASIAASPETDMPCLM